MGAAIEPAFTELTHLNIFMPILCDFPLLEDE